MPHIVMHCTCKVVSLCIKYLPNSMTHIDHIAIVNDGEDTEVPGEGSDGGGHSVRLAGSALDSHSAQLDQKKENPGVT